MSESIDRRDFVKKAGVGLAAVGGAPLAGSPEGRTGDRGSDRPLGAPAVLTGTAARPVVVSDVSGIRYTNDGPESAVERAFRGIVEGEDVLDALIAGVNIPEQDPEEAGIGYGGLPNAAGVVQLDACCMHGPRRWAGGVAAIEGVRTPSLVAKAVMEHTDHHLLVGEGARAFARQMGFTVEEDLNTDNSRALWREWRRRIDPEHWLDPSERLEGQGRGGAHDGGAGAEAGADGLRSRADAWRRAGLEMMQEGLIEPGSFWGTINCNGVGPQGDVCGVTTTSGLPWKIPGRVGDSPILGAGLYVDGDVGAAGSTGRGEANLFHLSSFLVVENLRSGMAPKDAGMAALERIRAGTVEPRLLNERGEPAFDVRFFIVNREGDYAGVAMYGARESHFAVCDENGAREEPLEGLLDGSPDG